MFNVLIFIIGAGIMFYMGLRSVLQRRRLQQKGQRVEADRKSTRLNSSH